MFFPPEGFGRISLRLKRESRNFEEFWMPVFTGTTVTSNDWFRLLIGVSEVLKGFRAGLKSNF
jgi:hypothetical protein